MSAAAAHHAAENGQGGDADDRAGRHVMRELPAFVEPMLARAGKPFDSERHLFEIKWDGTRALAFVDRRGHQLLNRRRVDMTARYPDLAFLADLDKGTVLDGEIVVLKAGRPDFNSLAKREHSRSARAIAMGAKAQPATFVAFDLLFDCYEVMMHRPLAERRQRLREIVARCGHPHLLMSEGVIGNGVAYFEEACKLELEGIVAKRLDSPYQPGKRTDAWIKIKRQQTFTCVVIGFTPSEDRPEDFSALVIATQIDGELKVVGRVGTGFDMPMRDRINAYLWSHLRDRPVVPNREKARWVEPGLYCTIRCMERTAGGQLRAPVLEELYGD